MNSIIVIFILLFPYNPNICNIPGCCVMHYPIPAHIKVYTSFEDAKKDWYEGVIAYKYDGELKQLAVEAITEVVQENRIKKELSDKPIESIYMLEAK